MERFKAGRISAKELKLEQLRLMKAERIQKLYDLIMTDIEAFTDEQSEERAVLVQRLVKYIQQRVDPVVLAQILTVSRS